MFATHYHELTMLENVISGVKNYNIAVKKRGDDITFLRRIVRGGADESYGIEVAKLAGVPQWIINRSKEVLKELESEEKTQEPNLMTNIEQEHDSLNLIDMSYDREIVKKLKNIDVNTLTQIESMNILFDLVKMAGD